MRFIKIDMSLKMASLRHIRNLLRSSLPLEGKSCNLTIAYGNCLRMTTRILHIPVKISIKRKYKLLLLNLLTLTIH
ncbi:hypothetical protein D3C77_534810 [compost metagenome]